MFFDLSIYIFGQAVTLYSPTVLQVAQLGQIVLGDCLKQVSPADSLPLMLATSNLMSPAGGPAESALLPLSLYNDALLLAQDTKQLQFISGLESQAHACVEELFKLMAGEVNRTRPQHLYLTTIVSPLESRL